jgi:ankyrin repeat protein
VCVCVPRIILDLSVHIVSSYYTLKQGDTALAMASMQGHVEVVKLLLAVPGIDYNHADSQV